MVANLNLRPLVPKTSALLNPACLPIPPLPRKSGVDVGLTTGGRRDLNSHAVKHWNLNPACLPIPPLPQVGWTMGLEPTTTGITIRGSTN